MFNYKSILLAFVYFVFSATFTFASNLDSLIQKTYLDKTSTISVSVKDVKTGKVVYEYNSLKLMNPASVQKIFTMRSAYQQLGADYCYKTVAYLDDNKNLYIKMSGDPSFSTESLIELLNKVKQNTDFSINDIVIDPTIFDSKQWGIGWMWDDDMSGLLPKYSPFSINQNLIKMTVLPAKNHGVPIIKNNSHYNLSVVNKLKNGNSNNIALDRMPWVNSDMTTFLGTVKSETNVYLPVNSPEKYFFSELKYSLSKVGLNFNGEFKVAPVSSNANKVAEICSEPLKNLVSKTLKESNNFYSEMIFKTAGAYYSRLQGTTEKAVEMLEKEFITIKDDGHIIVDACGISRNNLLTADWVTSALNKIYNDADFSEFSVLLPKPMEGTLSDRLLDISLNLRAKTGTASGISSIAGFIDTKAGKKYSFAIFIQNHNIDVSKIKDFEDKLIKEFYKL